MAGLNGPRLPPRSGGPARQLVALLHGVGADGADLIGFAPALAETLPDAAFVAPDAPYPCDMAPFGRQWFSLQDRSPARLVSLVKNWNANLELKEDTYTGAHIVGGNQFDFFGASLAAALPTGQWHHLAISIGAGGYAARVNGNIVASAPSSNPARSRQELFQQPSRPLPSTAAVMFTGNQYRSTFTASARSVHSSRP